MLLRESARLYPQSGAQMSPVESVTQSENVVFHDADTTYESAVYPEYEETRMTQDSDIATLGNFFSRPILIGSYDWAVGGSFYQAFNPWQDYFENARVSNRLTNYNLLRANLKIKIVINGNGMYYGRLIASYSPLTLNDDFTVNASLVPQDIIQASQLPHIYLDPTTSSGGEIMAPMLWYYNYMSIPNSDWQHMGEMVIRSINTLRHANGGTATVSVSVFAWAEDVELAVLTSVDTDTLTPQSGKEIDEANAKGIVSSPASTVARMAGALSTIPWLKPYAMATEMAASTIATIARSFGYSRPTITAGPTPLRPTPVSSLALCNAADTSQKLTVDHKNELSVDPRIVGVSEPDPLNIRAIATRESYIYTFPWNTANASGQCLWNARVTPVTWQESSANVMHFPACAMAALPFKYWTGTMKYRFQLVGSQFHRGRLAVFYDPNFTDFPLISDTNYNTNYVQIIDLGDTMDFTIEVKNGQQKTLLTNPLPGIDSVTTVLSTTRYSSVESYGNGVLAIYVLNELTSPSLTADEIDVNVFISAGDDFEVFVPDDHYGNFVLNPQSGLEPQSGRDQTTDNTAQPSAPHHTVTFVLGPTSSEHPALEKVFTGETIVSLRQLLKRFNHWRTLRGGTSGTFDRVTYFSKYPWFPILRGSYQPATAPDSTALGATYAYVNTSLLHWTTVAFRGMRGTLRYKVFPRLYGATIPPCMYVQRYNEGATTVPFSETTTVSSTFTTQSLAAWSTIRKTAANHNTDLLPTGGPGAAFTEGNVNPVLEFEVPFYSPRRFANAKRLDWTDADTDEVGGWYGKFRAHMSNSSAIDIYSAVGEDFQVYFFTGMPRMYYESAPPAA